MQGIIDIFRQINAAVDERVAERLPFIVDLKLKQVFSDHAVTTCGKVIDKRYALFVIGQKEAGDTVQADSRTLRDVSK